MIHFDLPKQKSSIIKVIGVGGGGSNAVNFMFTQSIEGVDFIICNTDAKALEQSRIPNKIQLGPHLTQGLGAGANPEIGKQATEESLDEIKKILEVNTKMAFICAGMGGGTGTGGAPIVAKICRDLGILTVGIVTTPFGFEGPRRHQQAELGIKELKPFVDTLLVISNDKLRAQYGNLKMKEAFCKADNVLATAAKCITDIINSTGHIIVDFADVCTVMKNGGVAILGKAEVAGEDRAQQAIEEALNSPLLNDSDIRGAKWILININSAEGDHECTMDELEIINNHLRMQAGENSDVIVGTGYDNELEDKIGITLIATGFEHKDPFHVKAAKPEVQQAPQKVFMPLNLDTQKATVAETPAATAKAQSEPVKDALEPVLVESPVQIQPVIEPVIQRSDYDDRPVMFELSTDIPEEKPVVSAPTEPNEMGMKMVEKQEAEMPSAVPEFLKRPTNIYTSALNTSAPAQPAAQEVKKDEITFIPPIANDASNINMDDYFNKPQSSSPVLNSNPTEEAREFEMIIKDNSEPAMHLPMQNEIYDEVADEQKRKAQDRIQKLRNISFTVNGGEANSEFDTVPAYVRRSMAIGNMLTSPEKFYSNYTVKTDENSDQAQISTINTFMDGKKPD